MGGTIFCPDVACGPAMKRPNAFAKVTLASPSASARPSSPAIRAWRGTPTRGGRRDWRAWVEHAGTAVQAARRRRETGPSGECHAGLAATRRQPVTKVFSRAALSPASPSSRRVSEEFPASPLPRARSATHRAPESMACPRLAEYALSASFCRSG